MTNWAKWLVSKVSLRHIANKARRIIPTSQEIQDLGNCFKHPGEISRWWSRLSPDRRRFLVNLIIGFVIMLFLNIFHYAPFRREGEDLAMDWVMQMRMGRVSSEPTIPFGWIDIDEKTYLDWREPLSVPRKKLAKIIQFALQCHPKIVVVDVDLAQRSHDRKFDQPVEDVLAEHAYKCRGKPVLSEDCPAVVLLASLRLPEKEESYPEQRNSHLDELVADSEHLFWASPLFDQDWDQTIRRWRIWEKIQYKDDSQLFALPSIQLLAATLLRDGEDSMEKLQQCLDSMASENNEISADQSVACKMWEASSQLANKKLRLSQSRIARRILYTIPWQRNTPGHYIGSIPTVRTYEGQENLLLSRVSALYVKDSKKQFDSSDFKGRVVFIGGSFRDSRDIHVTPLGEMPGVLILINSLYSLLQCGEAKELYLPLKILIEILLIALLTICFSVWDSLWGQIASSLTICAILIPFSVLLFGYGFWLDFALPLAAIQIHQVAADFEDGRAARRAASLKSSREGGSPGN
jgi:CHASE2 domain-containing sensor protein